MITWGINALNHGSSLAVFENNRLISNTFNKEDELPKELIYSCLDKGYPERIFWYERPWIKKARQFRAGQWNRVFSLEDLPKNYLKKINLSNLPITYTPHHASHAAAGYYTSPFNHCAIVVLDAIGEFECASIWEARHGEIKKIWKRSYPNSLGLFYSAFTDLIGLTPVQDEFKLQQLANTGDYKKYYKEVSNYFCGLVSLKKNLHKGVLDWPYEITEEDKSNIAAAVQKVFEEQIALVMTAAKSMINTDCLIYMGGCSMNSQANKLVVEPVFKYRFSLPQKGHHSSSIGAVLYHTKHRQQDIDLGLVKHITINV